MTEQEAKEQLRKMLDDFTPGTVLHLYGEVFQELAAEAHQENDLILHEQCKTVERALFVVGIGVDGAYPVE